jgi:hypothetical protein
MNTKHLTIILLLATSYSFGQNIGINTLTPQYPLHIFKDNGSAITTTEIAGTGFLAAKYLKTPGGIYNRLEINKWTAGASGTQAGIPLDNLSQVIAGVDAAALMLGTANNNPLHFVSNNIERMRLYANGTLSLNTLSTLARLNVLENEALKSAFIATHDNLSSGYAVQGRIFAPIGAAVVGYAFNGLSGGVSPFETNSYGVLGAVGNVGVGVGAFSNAGTAIRANATTGLALHSTGRLKLEGIGHAAGRILTSDASGEATWQDASTTTGWANDGTGNIYNNPNNAVMVGTSTYISDPDPYGAPIGFIVNNKHSLFYNTGGGHPSVRIINGGDVNSVPVEAGVGLYVNNQQSPAAIFKSAYTGLQVESTAVNTFWAAGRFTLNNTTSTANAFEIGNNSNGYALTVNNIGAGTNASGYFSNSNESYTTTSNIGIELNNSYLKVTGNARTMFEHSTTALNVSANQTTLNYPGMSATDMLVVTHVYTGTYIGAVGVWWDVNTWKIFMEGGLAATMPVGEKFNVMVVKR